MSILIETDFTDLLFLINRGERNGRTCRHILISTLFLSASGPLPQYQSLSILIARLNEAYGSSLDAPMLYDRAMGRAEASHDWWQTAIPVIRDYLREMQTASQQHLHQKSDT